MKTMVYGIKLNGELHRITREYAATVLKGTCIIRHRRLMDGTRVLATANGNVLYMQYMTRKMAANW